MGKSTSGEATLTQDGSTTTALRHALHDTARAETAHAKAVAAAKPQEETDDISEETDAAGSDAPSDR